MVAKHLGRAYSSTFTLYILFISSSILYLGCMEVLLKQLATYIFIILFMYFLIGPVATLSCYYNHRSYILRNGYVVYNIYAIMLLFSVVSVYFSQLLAVL